MGSGRKVRPHRRLRRYGDRMKRVVAALIAEIVVAVAVAYLLLVAWQWFLGGILSDAFGEAAYLLFFFNDVAMLVWVVILVILAIRRRRLPGVGLTLAFALLGVAVNVIMVAVIGFAQQGWFAFYVLFAIEAGVAFLVAVLMVAPVGQRLAAQSRHQVANASAAS